MGRLRTVRPRVSTVAPRLKRKTDAHGHDPKTQRWRHWYGSQRWKDLRWEVLLRDFFTCQWPGCGWQASASETHLLVADHKIPHRGDEALFWSKANLWTLCATCHNRAKQAEERSLRLG